MSDRPVRYGMILLDTAPAILRVRGQPMIFRGLADRTDEVKRRCRTVLQTQADRYTAAAHAILQPSLHVDSTLALV